MSSGVEVKENYFELKSMQIKKEYSFIYLNTYAFIHSFIHALIN